VAIGAIQGFPAGTPFASRRELYEAGVHRQLQAGIVGGAATGAESIVLSGGYSDDEDHGDVIIYTGHGGRDPKSGRQIANQSFTAQNQALVTSCLQGLPVRVVRGADHRSRHSPANGYRYDGLYRVDSYWHAPGNDGFSICRFRLVADSATSQPELAHPSQTGLRPIRVRTTTLRVVRDTALSKHVKERHDFRCQVCGIRLECEGGWYAEAAHIRPLGKPHDGPDLLDNLICLCPNHHVQFDYGGFSIAADLSLIGLPGRLVTVEGHSLNPNHLAYHRSLSGRDS
jgi:putative restriction endonuclease